MVESIAPQISVESKNTIEENVKTLPQPEIIDTPKAKAPIKTTTLNLSNILKLNTPKDQQPEKVEVKVIAEEPFTTEQIRATWMEFAELRKIYQAEYQLLSQAYDLQQNKITVALMHPVQETMLNNLRIELTTYLRERLKNNSISVVGELKVSDDKKMIYTPREKFDYLIEKNPLLKELKDRLGLDTDF